MTRSGGVTCNMLDVLVDLIFSKGNNSEILFDSLNHEDLPKRDYFLWKKFFPLRIVSRCNGKR